MMFQYVQTKDLPKIYGYSKATAIRRLNEMEKSSEFGEFVRREGHNMRLVRLDKFEEFSKQRSEFIKKTLYRGIRK